jgi:hypothetical protein
MGKVQVLVVLLAAVRVREDGVGLLEAGETDLTPARVIRVPLFCERPVGVLDLGSGGVSGYAKHLIVIDLLRHRPLILTYIEA